MFHSIILFVSVLCFIGNVGAFSITPTKLNFMKSSIVSNKLPLFSTVTDAPAPAIESEEEKIIIITPKAMAHITDLKAKQNGLGHLRMGVRSGGCSGMSYIMDFIPEDQILEEDHIETYGDVKCVGKNFVWL
jgi:hypothetical protein